MHSPVNKQSGLALITVLFIFALVSLMAISMQQQQSMNIAQASATFTQSQAMQMVYSAEEIAKAGLKIDLDRDLQQNEEWDVANELWNMYFPVKLDRANVEVNIRDLQGLFNINWLDPKAPNSALAASRFIQLITEVAPSFGAASEVANNVKNWFTPDHSSNYNYQNKTPAYSAGQQPMTHPSELKLVEGVTPDLYDKLEPYITALPNTVQLNVNTTTKEILTAWDPGISSGDANTLASKTRSGVCGQGRSESVYKTVQEFMETSEIKKILDKQPNGSGDQDSDKSDNNTTNIQSADFTVKSTYFSVLTRVTMDIDGDGQNDVDFNSESIIRRKPNSSGKNDGFIGVIYRDFSREVSDFSRLKIVNC